MVPTVGGVSDLGSIDSSGVPALSSRRAASRTTRLRALQACGGFAAAMGIGRFAYTPILPAMQDQTGVAHSAMTAVATANYLGYFLGAAVLIARPGWGRSSTAYRAALVALMVCEVAMIAGTGVAPWAGIRLVAGVASAIVF